VIGVNVIPQPTKSRDPAKFTPWKPWQDKSIPTEDFEQWIKEGRFRDAEGIGIIVGKVWRGKHTGEFLIFIDCDNNKAIEEFCTLNEQTVTLPDIAQKFIVEQHEDDPNRAHIYFYSVIPFIQKASDANNKIFTKEELEANPYAKAADELATKVEALPAFEIKGLGNHGMAFSTNSLHKNGYRYKIIGGGTMVPITLTKDTAEEMMYHLDAICRKHRLTYLQNAGIEPTIGTSRGGSNGGDISAAAFKNNRALLPMTELLRDDYRVLAGHNRHLDLLRVMEHFLVVDPEHALQKSKDWNQKHCVPPKTEVEFNRDWRAAKNFIDRQNVIRTESNPNADSRGSMLPEAVAVVGTEDVINSAMNTQSDLQELGYSGCERLTDNEILIHYKDGKKIRVSFKNPRWERAFEKDMRLILGKSVKKGDEDNIVTAGLSFLLEVYRAMLMRQRRKEADDSLKKFDLRKTENWGFSLSDVLKFGVNEDELADSQPSKEISVSDLIRARPGRYVTPGIISSVTSNYRMVRGEIFECKNCLQEATFVYKRPDDDKPTDWKSAAEEMVETAERTNDAMFKALHEATDVNAYVKCARCSSDNNDPTAVMKFKEYDFVPTVEVELRDPDNIGNEMDGARVKIFGVEETANIRVGEPVKVSGKLYILKTKGKPNGILFAEKVEYTGREVIEITDQDKEWIANLLKEHGGEDKIIDKLVEMHSPEIVGHDLIKKGLLMVEVYTGPDIISRTSPKAGNYNRERNRIHAALVGPPASVKTWFLKAAVRHIPNSLYVSAQGVASGKSLTAIISKEEGERTYTLRHGPVALAREAICAINEIGRLDPEDQGYLLDAAEEGMFTKDAHGFHIDIRADSSLVVSANPKSDANMRMMKDPTYRLTLDDVPFLRELIDRFDLLFVTRYDTDEDKLQAFVDKKDEMEEKGVPNYDEQLRKYLQYAKTTITNPTISKDARELLKDAYIELAKKGFGSPRIRNTLYRITRAIARLKLKKEAEYKDAEEALQFYRAMLIEFTNLVVITERSKDLAYRVMVEILRESQIAVLFNDLTDRACDRNTQIADYIGNIRYIDGNRKLRAIRDMLAQDSRIMQVQDKPIALKWVGRNDNNSSSEKDNPSDTSDVSDAPGSPQTSIGEIFEGVSHDPIETGNNGHQC
jgi:DNA replicative helicase MCM subunit Mcm2 (Cdc46/Mcm family)